MEYLQQTYITSLPMADPDADDSFSDIVTRSLVSVGVCVVLSWQVIESAGFRRSLGQRFGGSPLQWFLIALMALAALEGVLATVADVMLLARADAAVADSSSRLRALKAEVSLALAVGRVDQAVVALLILGLGIAGTLTGVADAPVALVLGGGALLLGSWLPAPLVLVVGVWRLQRRTSGWRLRCALRPLLVLACLEALYAWFPVRAFEDSLAEARREEGEVLSELVRANLVDDTMANDTLALIDSMRPAVLLEVAQQGLGDLVLFGTTLALSLSARSRGVRRALLPAGAALAPGLPSSFAVVFVFLLETREAQAGALTLLPLHDTPLRAGAEERVQRPDGT